VSGLVKACPRNRSACLALGSPPLYTKSRAFAAEFTSFWPPASDLLPGNSRIDLRQGCDAVHLSQLTRILPPLALIDSYFVYQILSAHETTPENQS
jgi:hypothetical protein